MRKLIRIIWLVFGNLILLSSIGLASDITCYMEVTNFKLVLENKITHEILQPTSVDIKLNASGSVTSSKPTGYPSYVPDYYYVYEDQSVSSQGTNSLAIEPGDFLKTAIINAQCDDITKMVSMNTTINVVSAPAVFHDGFYYPTRTWGMTSTSISQFNNLSFNFNIPAYGLYYVDQSYNYSYRIIVNQDENNPFYYATFLPNCLGDTLGFTYPIAAGTYDTGVIGGYVNTQWIGVRQLDAGEHSEPGLMYAQIVGMAAIPTYPRVPLPGTACLLASGLVPLLPFLRRTRLQA